MRPRARRVASRGAPLLALLVALLALVPGRAHAYPWMVQHGYTACAQCHVDPSGAGTLTDYGRAQGEILLRTHYGKEKADPEKISQFGFGAIPLPEPLQLQADVRGMYIPVPTARFILMQADARAAVQAGIFSASGSIGAVSEGGQGAWLSSNPSWNLVSREYWLGVTPAKGLTIRAGRMNLPFGIRTEDHIVYVRSATNTTINDDQQLGLAVAFGNRKIRAEVMGIAGNFQVSPDDFRKRGYSAFAAYAINKKLEIGISSLFTKALADVDTLAPRTYLANGVFTRLSPAERFSIMAEADVLLDNRDGDRSAGLAGLAEVDFEATQGLHVIGLGEYCSQKFSQPNDAVWRAGAAAQWFFASRLDVRVDGGYGTVFCTPGADPHPYGLVQAHVYL